MTRPVRTSKDARPRLAWLYSTRLHVVMYSLLLVATPFLILRTYLQDAIGRLSDSRWQVAGWDIPIIPTLAAAIAGLLVVLLRRYITILRLLAVGIILLMNALSQRFVDFYFGHHFWHLQQNWHYIAYAIFAILVYRDLAPRRFPLARMFLWTYVCAVAYSTFDELFQMNMRGRAFEMNDIAKDAWGSLMGMVLVYLGPRSPSELWEDCRHVRHRTLRSYLANPASVLLILGLFTFLVLFFSCLLTDLEYWWLTLLLAIASFPVCFTVLHVSQHRWGRYGLTGLASLLVLVQGYFYVKYRDGNIVYNNFGLTVYRGFPVVFFDLMVFPDGSFRLVDKKHFFRNRDLGFLLKQQTDILVIGSGAEGLGGKGFPRETTSQFLYNPTTKRGAQLIILRTPEACEVFNRLKRERKNVLLVLHNTC